MQILGVVGGIASGKSAVSAELAALGAVVLDADQAAHSAINLPEVKQQLVDRWGVGVLAESGDVDRAAVARRVFSGSGEDNAELRFLEQTLHPRIRQQFQAELARLAPTGVPAVVIDAPLLLEAGWENLCDEVIFVDSARRVRLARAAQRGWTEQDFSRREQAQMPIEEKKRKATQIIRNDGTRAALKARVFEIWQQFPTDQ
ncbi:MAG: dephospho-CoA kinase [Planctomycetales bacterium]|nr:dephospho-CoA kinase [Planctomycetales bacterium]